MASIIQILAQVQWIASEQELAGPHNDSNDLESLLDDIVGSIIAGEREWSWPPESERAVPQFLHACISAMQLATGSKTGASSRLELRDGDLFRNKNRIVL